MNDFLDPIDTLEAAGRLTIRRAHTPLLGLCWAATLDHAHGSMTVHALTPGAALERLAESYTEWREDVRVLARARATWATKEAA